MASLARRLRAVVRGRDARAGLLAAVGGRRLPHRGRRFPGRPGGNRAGAELRRRHPPVPRRHPPLPAAVPASAGNCDPNQRGRPCRPGGDRVGAHRPRDRQGTGPGRGRGLARGLADGRGARARYPGDGGPGGGGDSVRGQGDLGMDNIGALIVPAVIALVAISIVAKGVRVVQQAQTMIIERLGKYHRTLASGVNLIIPIIDKPRAIDWHQVIVTPAGDSFARHFRTDKIDLRETVYVFPRQNVITKDNVVVEIDALIYSQITDPVRATYEIANLPDAIEKLTQTTLRNVIGEMELDHVLSSRDTINAKLREILDDATHKWGAKVSRVELKDINPPRDIRDAMEKQMRAERDRRAAILTAEAEKQSRILQAEGIRQSEITQAEGGKQARILAAEAEANARLKVAEAEAQAIERITSAIKGTGGDPARYLIAIRYIEALKEMVTSPQSNKVVYLPYEATGVLASLGGIREMLAGPAAEEKGRRKPGL